MHEEFISKLLEIKKEKNDILSFLLAKLNYKDYYDEIENLIDNGKDSYFYNDKTIRLLLELYNDYLSDKYYKFYKPKPRHISINSKSNYKGFKL